MLKHCATVVTTKQSKCEVLITNEIPECLDNMIQCDGSARIAIERATFRFCTPLYNAACVAGTGLNIIVLS